MFLDDYGSCLHQPKQVKLRVRVSLCIYEHMHTYHSFDSSYTCIVVHCGHTHPYTLSPPPPATKSPPHFHIFLLCHSLGLSTITPMAWVWNYPREHENSLHYRRQWVPLPGQQPLATISSPEHAALPLSRLWHNSYTRIFKVVKCIEAWLNWRQNKQNLFLT